ncbi:YacL family protein, partial [Glaesserella parasuis]
MEYQFTHTMHGVIAKCSMDHEAFARWLNTEIVPNPKELKDQNYEWIFEGKEYSLYINIEEVMVKANNLDMTFEEIEDVEN